MKLDYLNATNYQIEQPDDFYHFNSDTELLGRFMRLKRNDVVLDIGCATGALMLYAAHQRPKEIYGIDLFAEVIEQANKNLKRNQVEAFTECCSLQEYKRYHYFDVVVCNPPYFATKNDDLTNDNPILKAARHETYLSLEELFKNVPVLLKDNGVFYLVHRSERLHEIILIAQKNGLYLKRMRIAYQSLNKKAKSVLFCFCKDIHCQLQIDSPIFLNDRSTFENMKGSGR